MLETKFIELTYEQIEKIVSEEIMEAFERNLDPLCPHGDEEIDEDLLKALRTCIEYFAPFNEHKAFFEKFDPENKFVMYDKKY
jgi:hypothetical protein